jgi:hypothetical protein
VIAEFINGIGAEHDQFRYSEHRFQAEHSHLFLLCVPALTIILNMKKRLQQREKHGQLYRKDGVRWKGLEIVSSP